jgi:euchromatic histone-lysine N-methyltransferase
MVVQSLEGVGSVQSSIDVEGDAANPHSEENSSPQKRRVSSRLQVKQKPQKELLVRRRVELLDDNEEGPRKKANVRGRQSLTSENEVAEVPKSGLEGGISKASDSVEKSDHVRVKETLRLFNKHYLYFVQVSLLS